MPKALMAAATVAATTLIKSRGRTSDSTQLFAPTCRRNYVVPASAPVSKSCRHGYARTSSSHARTSGKRGGGDSLKLHVHEGRAALLQRIHWVSSERPPRDARTLLRMLRPLRPIMSFLSAFVGVQGVTPATAATPAVASG